MITKSQILDTLQSKMEPGRQYRSDELYSIVLWSAYLTAEDWYSNWEDLQGRPNWRGTRSGVRPYPIGLRERSETCMSGWNDKRRVILPCINKVKPLDKCIQGPQANGAETQRPF